MDTLLLSKFVASLILPPGGILLLMLVGLIVRAWRPRLGMALLLCGLSAYYLLSVGAVARMLMEPLERVAPLSVEARDAFGAEAIVVLGGGRRSNAPEYGGETVSPATLERIRYAAHVHRESGLPLAVSGGVVRGDAVPEAELMKRVLEEDFGVRVQWVESRSRNTEQNAVMTRDLLERHGVTRVLLVTHAAHLSRAAVMFRATGLAVLEAPTAFIGDSREPLSWRDWVPNSGAQRAAWFALHEHLGRLWFQLRRQTGFADTT